MSFSIQQFSQVFSERFHLELKAGEAGRSNQIKRLAVMETPDFYPGADPDGMLALTTLSFVKENPATIESVLSFISAQPAGLVIKVNRYFAQTPAMILEHARRNSVPVFELSGNIAFSDLLSSVTKEILKSTQNGLFSSNGLEARSMRKYMNDEPLEELLDSVERFLGLKCFFMDIRGVLTYRQAKEQKNLSAAYRTTGLKLLEKALGYRNEKEYFRDGDSVSFICRAGKTLLGVLVIPVCANVTEEIEDIVSQTLSFIAVRIFEQLMSDRSSDKHYARSVLDELLYMNYSDCEIVREFLGKNGLKLQSNFVFVVLLIRDEYSANFGASMIDYCRAQLEARFPNRIMSWDSRGIKSIISFPDNDVFSRPNVLRDKLISFMKSALTTNESMIDIGLSLIQTNPVRIPLSFTQAQRAITLGRVYRPDKHLYDYQAFVVQGLLSRCKDTQELNWIKKSIIEPISERDRLYESGLWETLSILFIDRSLKAAAAEMHIHISTLRYRLQKILEITGYDYFSAYGSYMLHTAYIIWLDEQIR